MSQKATTATVGGGRPGVTRPNWVLAKIIDGDVHRSDDWEYRVFDYSPRPVDGQPVDDRCTDAVYALEEAGLIVLRKKDGSPVPTAEGRRHHERTRGNGGQNALKRQAKTTDVVFQAAA